MLVYKKMIIIVVIGAFRPQRPFLLTLTVLSGLGAPFVSTLAALSGLSGHFCQPLQHFRASEAIFVARLPDPHHRPMQNKRITMKTRDVKIVRG